MERVLVTGADGFVGGHLLEELRHTGCELFGLGLKPGAAREVEGLTYAVADLTDFDRVEEVLRALGPDTVFHLAAQPSVALSWRDPWVTYRVNVLGQVNLMEAARRLGLAPSVHIACSSEEYGRVGPEGMPLSEDRRLAPCSHYAVSKVAQESLGLMYQQAFGWRIIVTRGFNQAGPGQSPDFVVSSFARQLAMIETGDCEPVLRVGNLDARRDFTDVRDTARAYRMLMESGSSGAVYNVCSGRTCAISELLEVLLSLSDAEVAVEPDPERQRPSDIPVLSGDNTRLREDTGWEPRIPLEKTMLDTLEYWRNRLDGEDEAGGGE